LNTLQIVFNGIIKGLGKQQMASIIVLIILYPINIPMAYFLAFVFELDIYGLWYAQLSVVYLLAFSYITIVTMVDWQKIADKVNEEVEKEKLEVDKLQ
jgi:MATE family multidrug resistance protein